LAYPRMMRISRSFRVEEIDGLSEEIRRELAKLPLRESLTPGASVALAVGSRGIDRIALIIHTLVQELRGLGARPFVVPAMGSHGGATAEGQQRILCELGITERSVEAPIESSMEVVQIGSTAQGLPVLFDSHAYKADHVVVVNRVKCHTEYSGDIQSGLNKILVIGLGNHQGAGAYHKAIQHLGFERVVRSACQVILRRVPILFGLALVENQRHRIGVIRALRPRDFWREERGLLRLASSWMARLPFSRADLLIVDEIGKNLSGSGMDTNVIGRKRFHHQSAEKEWPKITRIFARDLSRETGGNAIGIGMADFTLRRLVDKIDTKETYTNCITCNDPAGASIPIYFDTDREVLDAAFQTIGNVEPERAKIIRIRNTLELEELLVSEAYQEELAGRSDIRVAGEVQRLAFDERGDLLPF
jgi:hypothetical protein